MFPKLFRQTLNRIYGKTNSGKGLVLQGQDGKQKSRENKREEGILNGHKSSEFQFFVFFFYFSSRETWVGPAEFQEHSAEIQEFYIQGQW